MTQSNDQGDSGQIIAIDEATRRWKAEQAEADEDERQFGLFAEPRTEAGRAKAIVYKRGPGRPPGSRNKRTERTVAFLLARHRDPREILLEMAAANVHDLAALYGCSPFEAAQEKRLAAIAVLPYVAARITPEVVDNRQIVHLHFGALEGGAGTSSASGLGTVHVLDPSEFEEQQG